MPNACKDCAFWAYAGPFKDGIEDTDYGECRRYAPPFILQEDAHRTLGIWGKTLATAWCGEFKLKAGPPAVEEHNDSGENDDPEPKARVKVKRGRQA